MYACYRKQKTENNKIMYNYVLYIFKKERYLKLCIWGIFCGLGVTKTKAEKQTVILYLLKLHYIYKLFNLVISQSVCFYDCRFITVKLKAVISMLIPNYNLLLSEDEENLFLKQC